MASTEGSSSESSITLYSPVWIPTSNQLAYERKIPKKKNRPRSRSNPGGDKNDHFLSLTPSHMVNAMREQVINARTCLPVRVRFA